MEANQIAPVTVSPSAVAKLKAMFEEEATPGLMLRMFVQGGGCSGFQYGFSFESEQASDDFKVEQDEVAIVIDCMSMQYLSGANLDYIEDLEGTRFVVNNPNASSSCGCGSSFSA